MTSEEYAEKLNHPMWHKVRAFMLMRDDYTCQHCGAKREWGYKLHVHHKRYISGREPCEYGTDDLTTLCEQCHCKEHGIEYFAPNSLVPVGRFVDAVMNRLANEPGVAVRKRRGKWVVN